MNAIENLTDLREASRLSDAVYNRGADGVPGPADENTIPRDVRDDYSVTLEDNWRAPIGWSGLIVSASLVSGPLERCFRARVGGSPERYAASKITTARTSSVFSSVPRCILRPLSRLEPPCLRACHAPSPSALMPMLSIRRFSGPVPPR